MAVERVILTPNRMRAAEIRRFRADGSRTLSFGVKVTTLSCWIDDLWSVWGDGRRFTDVRLRRLLIKQAIAKVPGLEPTAGAIVRSKGRSRCRTGGASGAGLRAHLRRARGSAWAHRARRRHRASGRVRSLAISGDPYRARPFVRTGALSAGIPLDVARYPTGRGRGRPGCSRRGGMLPASWRRLCAAAHRGRFHLREARCDACDAFRFVSGCDVRGVACERLRDERRSAAPVRGDPRSPFSGGDRIGRHRRQTCEGYEFRSSASVSARVLVRAGKPCARAFAMPDGLPSFSLLGLFAARGVRDRRGGQGRSSDDRRCMHGSRHCGARRVPLHVRARRRPGCGYPVRVSRRIRLPPPRRG